VELLAYLLWEEVCNWCIFYSGKLYRILCMGKEKCPKCGNKNEKGWKFCGNCAYKNENETLTRATCSYYFVVMGAGGVGKSAITIQFISKQFEAKYDPTIEDRYQKVIDYREVPCFLEILDSAGQETFSAMRELYMKNGEGFILVFSITQKQSFVELEPIKQGIMKYNQDPVLILVGNKLDLASKREVPIEEGRARAAAWHCPFIESSAKDNLNITEIFHTLIQTCWDKQGGPPKQVKKTGCNLL